MDLTVTKVFRMPWDVDRRLAELGLTRKGLLKIVGIAVNEAANATPYHCANAAGTLAYQYGTWALRDEYVGPDWALERPNNVEAIWNEERKVRVIFSNVDIACDDDQKPKPRSDKGAGAERVCVGNLFGRLPDYAPRQYAGEATYYLMADERGVAELTRPVISAGTFSGYVERIYLPPIDDDSAENTSLDDGDVADGFDPQIVRR